MKSKLKTNCSVTKHPRRIIVPETEESSSRSLKQSCSWTDGGLQYDHDGTLHICLLHKKQLTVLNNRRCLTSLSFASMRCNIFTLIPCRSCVTFPELCLLSSFHIPATYHFIFFQMQIHKIIHIKTAK